MGRRDMHNTHTQFGPGPGPKFGFRFSGLDPDWAQDGPKGPLCFRIRTFVTNLGCQGSIATFLMDLDWIRTCL